MKSKKIIALLMSVLLVLSFMAGCGDSSQPAPAQTPAQENQEEASPEAPAGETRKITDMLGREVEVPATVNTIVALGNTPRLITYLGLADKVVGYSGMDPEKATPACAYAYANKERWANVPIVGTDAGGQTDYYPEEIIKAAPDIILATCPLELAQDLEKQIGIPVFVVKPDRIMTREYDQCLLLLGEVCGVEEKAQEVVDYIHACLDDLANRTKDIPEDEKPDVLSAAATFKGAHGLEGVRIKDAVMEAAGAKNLAAELDGQSLCVITDMEQILAWNPEYIFLDSGGVGLVRQDAKEHPDFYEKLRAFNEGKVYQYPSSTSYYENLEIPLANSYFVGSVLYPEQFKDINVRDKANEIMKYFLGVDDYMSVLEETGQGYCAVELGKD